MPGFRRLRQGRGEEAEAESGRVGADGAAAGAEEGHGQVQAHLRGIHDEALQGGPHGDGRASKMTLNKLKFGPNYVIYCKVCLKSPGTPIPKPAAPTSVPGLLRQTL